MSVKAMARKIIANLPDEATFADIQYRLSVLECIGKGEKEIAEGTVFTDAQVRERLAKWLR